MLPTNRMPTTTASLYHGCSARVEAVEASTDARRKYNRRPPKRRVNYATVGVPSPFHTEWASVARVAHVEECVWPECEHEKRVRVCRLYSGLHELLDAMRAAAHNRSGSGSELGGAAAATAEAAGKANVVGVPSGSLLCVHVVLAHRGAPTDGAMICAPTDADVAELIARPSSAAHGPR